MKSEEILAQCSYDNMPLNYFGNYHLAGLVERTGAAQSITFGASEQD